MRFKFNDRGYYRTMPDKASYQTDLTAITATLRGIVVSIVVATGSQLVACSEDSGDNNSTPAVIPEQPNTPGSPTTPDTPVVPVDPDNGSEPQDPSVSLPSLPAPALTAAPTAGSGPIAEPSDFNTAVGFQVVTDQEPPLDNVSAPELTDEDFNAGTPEPVLQIPDDVDPLVNSAPFFEGLQNIQVFAGDTISIVYRPLDDDGDVPGMFFNELPRGASFDDNFDGSKTFTWTPLQSDVGITDFVVTALDAQNPAYRYTQAILIRTVLPADTTAITNEPPFLERLPGFSFTARVGDPVVVELKGDDRNDTTPIVEIPDPPDGAAFNPHPRREGVYVLKFTPTQVGNLTLAVQLRDAVDPTLITTEFFDINVEAGDYPPRTGQRLKDLADQRSILFGYASSPFFYQRADGALYADIAAAEFNLVTPESSMKMDQINPLPGRYDFADIDTLINFARVHGMQVHGHPLVWYRQNPLWIQTAPLTALQGHMQEHIDRIMSRYKNDISIWDVVNEPIADNGGLRNSIWYQAMGESYIDIALLQARATDPDAVLLINEFDAAIPGAKQDSLFELLNNLRERNTPLDGVGFQLHIFAGFDQFDAVRESFQRVADLGLDIYITELDVSLSDGRTLADQALVYQRVVELCLEQPRCRAIQTWGFTDQYSFRRQFSPLLFDTTYQEKPAYRSVQQQLQR